MNLPPLLSFEASHHRFSDFSTCLNLARPLSLRQGAGVSAVLEIISGMRSALLQALHLGAGVQLQSALFRLDLLYDAMI